ncbi:hypothetical protein DY000_02014878 [Brassica cretica]|uniref:JmjN domain-containing protein n=1 Tax=Brassica cretica TaxID=69181 RepID=A0ABQ7D902_BRACR|nr:hypothetical protein DY000_02014878 [Brassica cretica]
MSKASHLDVPKHQRPPIWTEEAAEFHKRVKRIHDPVKIVVPCAVSEVEFPIPPDKGVHLNSYIEVLDDHQHIEASQRGLRFRDEVDKGLAATRYHRTTSHMQYRTTSTSRHRLTLPLLHRSTLGAYQSRRSSMCVEIFLMEKPPRDQTSLGERRGEIGRREKGPRRFSVIIDSSLLRWCQEIQSAQKMLLKAICKGSSTP